MSLLPKNSVHAASRIFEVRLVRLGSATSFGQKSRCDTKCVLYEPSSHTQTIRTSTTHVLGDSLDSLRNSVHLSQQLRYYYHPRHCWCPRRCPPHCHCPPLRRCPPPWRGTPSLRVRPRARHRGVSNREIGSDRERIGSRPNRRGIGSGSNRLGSRIGLGPCGPEKARHAPDRIGSRSTFVQFTCTIPYTQKGPKN